MFHELSEVPSASRNLEKSILLLQKRTLLASLHVNVNGLVSCTSPPCLAEDDAVPFHLSITKSN